MSIHKVEYTLNYPFLLMEESTWKTKKGLEYFTYFYGISKLLYVYHCLRKVDLILNVFVFGIIHKSSLVGAINYVVSSLKKDGECFFCFANGILR